MKRGPNNVLRDPNAWENAPRDPASIAISAIGYAQGAGILGAVSATFVKVATLAVSLGLSVATSAIISALTPAPPTPKQSLLVNSRDPAAPQEFVYGETRKGGPITYLETTRGGSVLYEIIPIAAHEIQSVDAIYINDEVATLSNDAYSNSRRSGAGWVTNRTWSDDPDEHEIRIFYHLGDQTAITDTFANSSTESLDSVFFNTGSADEDSQNFGGAGQPTKASFVGNGIAYLFVRFGYASSVFQNGIPIITAQIKGKKVFDPRTSTTAYSNNAALCIRDYLTSAYGLNDSEIDDTVLSAAANTCDEDVTLDAGGTEDRYTMNGVVRADQAYGDVLQQMITSCGGTLFWGAGQWKLAVGEYNAPTKTLTLDDLRSNISLQTRVNLRDQFNKVQGVFNDASNRFIAADYPPIESATFVAQDNGVEQALDLDLPFTTSAATAQRLAKMTLFRGREQMVFQAEFGLNAFDVEVGEIVALTISRYGWTAKEFEVVNWRFFIGGEGDLRVALSLRETSEDAFAWDAEEAAIIGNDSSLSVDPEPVSNLTASAYGVISADGTFTNGILVDWDSSPSAGNYELEWTVNDSIDYSANGGIVEEADAVTTRELFIYKGYIEILYRQPDQDGFDFYNTGGGAGLDEADFRAQLLESSERSSVKFAGITVREPTTQHVIKPVLDATIYNIRVRAFDAFNRRSEWRSVTFTTSVKDGTVPNAPTSLAAVGSYRSVSLKWTAPTANTDTSALDDLAYYVIYRGTSTNPTTEHARTASNTFVDTKDISDDTTYHYRVKAFDFSGNGSAYSGSVSATTAPYDANAIKLDAETGGSVYFDQDGDGNLTLTDRGIDPVKLGSLSLSSFGEVNGVTLNAPLDRVIVPVSSGLANGDQVVFTKIIGEVGTKAGIQTGEPYYLANETLSGQFQLSTTFPVSSGSIVNITESDFAELSRTRLTKLIGVHINTAYWPDQFRAYQNSATEYAAYFENLSTSGGTVQVRSQGGFTGQFLTSTAGSGYAAIDAQNTATGGGKAQICLSSSDGGYAYNSVTGGYYDLGGDGYLPFTGKHDGMILKAASYEFGDILVDSRVIVKKVSDVFTELAVSSVANDASAVGVISEVKDWYLPASFIDNEATRLAQSQVDYSVVNPESPIVTLHDATQYQDDYDLVHINSVGEGSINVCGEGGDISKGDLIVTSNIPGKGMKQADDIVRSYTVAKAREDVTFSSPTDVKMVPCIYLCG